MNPGMPSAGASTASEPSSFQKYEAICQCAGDDFHKSRVSTLRPLRLNSFQNLVPTGKSHARSEVASIVVPRGSEIHLRLLRPSDHSGYCGRNGRTPGPIVEPSAA